MDLDPAGDSPGPPPPLAGFRVLDLTRFLAGPYAAGIVYDKHPEAAQ